MILLEPPAAAAYHEAGHVVVAHLLGGEVIESTLESERDDHAGHTGVVWRGLADDERLRCSGLVALGGPVAEILWLGEDALETDLGAWRADQAEVDAALGISDDPAERVRLHRQWLAEVAATLQAPATWERVCRVADALEAHGTLDAVLLDELLQ